MKNIPTITIRCAHFVDEKGNVVEHSKGCYNEGKTKTGGGSGYNPDYWQPTTLNNTTTQPTTNVNLYDSIKDVIKYPSIDSFNSIHSTMSSNSITYKPSPSHFPIKSIVNLSNGGYNLSNGGVSKLGIIKMANDLKNGLTPQVKQLDLSGNNIGVEEILALVEAIESPKVLELFVVLEILQNGQDLINFINKAVKYYMSEIGKKIKDWENPNVYSETPCKDWGIAVGKNLAVGLVKCATKKGIYLKGLCVIDTLLDTIPESLSCIAQINDVLFREQEMKKQEEIKTQPQFSSYSPSDDQFGNLFDDSHIGFKQTVTQPMQKPGHTLPTSLSQFAWQIEPDYIMGPIMNEPNTFFKMPINWDGGSYPLTYDANRGMYFEKYDGKWYSRK